MNNLCERFRRKFIGERIGFLARYNWLDPEQSSVVSIEDRLGFQLFDSFAVDWLAHKNLLRVTCALDVDINPEYQAQAEVTLGSPPVDFVGDVECSLKFCTDRSEADRWLQSQLEF